MSNFKSIINLFDGITYNDVSSLNIFVKYKLFDRYKSNIQYYLEYTILENDRWDIISQRFYGTFELWWLIALFNDIIDPFEKIQTGEVLKIIQPQYLGELLLALRKIKKNQ